MATERTYLIVIKADDRYDTEEEGDVYADTEKLMFVMNGALPSQGVEVTRLDEYALGSGD